MPALLHSSRRWFATLKFRIVLLAVLTGLLSAAGTAAIVVRSAQQSIERVVLQAARGDRERSAAVLASKVSVLQGALAAVARRTPAAAWSDKAAMARYLLDKPALSSLFYSVYAADPSGALMVRVEGDALSNQLPHVGDRKYFQRAMRADQPVISDVVRGKVLNAPIVVIAVPVLAPDGRHLGVVAGSLALQSAALFDELRATARDDAVSDLVVDRSGRILAHEDPARLMQQAQDEPGLRRLVGEWVAAGSPIDTVGVAHIEGEHVVSLAGIALTDWMHIRVAKASVALAPVAEAQASALPAAVLAGLCAGLAAGALGWFITRPISRLQQRAETLLHDAEGVSGWPDDAGEVGQLANAFRHVVEQRKRQQTAVQALLAQLQAVLDHAEVGIALTRHGCFELVSRQFCQMFRCTKADAVGRPTRCIYPGEDAFQSFAAQAGPALTQHGVVDAELELLRHDGQVFWARLRGRAVAAGDIGQGTIWTIEDVTAAREHNERLAFAASHDALTGLPNRAAFERLLDEATAGVAGQPFCALFIDLDRFKHVNDTGGHAAGDALLSGIAQVFGDTVRRSDVVARLGGDEFAVLLPGCPPDRARAIADKLCAAVQGYALAWDAHRFTVGASVGLVAVDESFKTAADVLRAADAACYAAKKRGRSRVEQYQASGPQDFVAA